MSTNGKAHVEVIRSFTSVSHQSIILRSIICVQAQKDVWLTVWFGCL